MEPYFKSFPIEENDFPYFRPVMGGIQQCEGGYTYGPAIRRYYIVEYILSGKGVYTVGGVAPQIMTMFTQGEGESLAAMLGALVSMLFASLMLGLVVVGIVFLIRYRKRFLPIESPLPRCRKPFYLNVGWFVACTVFVGMFLAVELLK